MQSNNQNLRERYQKLKNEQPRLRIRNAAQAMADSRGHITVRVHQRDKLACVDVIDNGPGIPEEHPEPFPWSVNRPGQVRPFCRILPAGRWTGRSGHRPR